MAWKDSSSCTSPDLSQYDIPGKYWEEAEIRESFFEEVGGGIPTDLETSRITGCCSVKKKSEDVWPTFRVRDRNRAEEMQEDRKLSSIEGTFRSRKTYGGHPRAKEVPSFATCRQPNKEINLVGCKAGISGLLFFRQPNAAMLGKRDMALGVGVAHLLQRCTYLHLQVKLFVHLLIGMLKE